MKFHRQPGLTKVTNETHSRAAPIIAILAVAGVALVLFATRSGIGISPDSTVYLDAARNLLSGSGFSVLSERTADLIPLTHYPPLYPALLALIGKSGVPLASAARLFNAILFGVNIGLVGLCISLYARGSFWLPVVGSALTLTAVDVAGWHSFALTEPLFLFFALSGLLCLALYIERQRRGFLIAAAVAIALSVLTRYVGVALLITVGLTLLSVNARHGRTEMLSATAAQSHSNHRTMRRRVSDAFVFEAIACLPVAVWAIRNRLEAGGATERRFVFHPVKLQQLVAGFSVIAQWLLVGKVRAGVRVVAFLLEAVLVIGLSSYLWQRGRDSEFVNRESRASKLPLVLGIFIAVYVAFLIFTATFIDADTVFDNRSLVPVHVAGMILVLCMVWKLYRRSHTSRSVHTVFVVLTLLLTASQSFRTVGWLRRTSSDGQGYASRAWTESETIAAVKGLPPDIPIYSNGRDAIYYLTGRRAIFIPEKIIHSTGRPNQNYDGEVEKMAGDIREHNGVVVYFHALPERTYLPPEDELRRRLPFEVATRADGSIFRTQIQLSDK